MLPIQIINKSENPLPEYKTEGSVGMDLCAYCPKDDSLESVITVDSKQTALIPTGLYMAIPYGYEGNIKPRSGLSLKEGLVAIEGTIDSDYRGEIGIIIRNNSNEPKIIKSGDRIAQIVFRKVERAHFHQVEELDETERGQGGFGSTGINRPKKVGGFNANGLIPSEKTPIYGGTKNMDNLTMDILDKNVKNDSICLDRVIEELRWMAECQNNSIGLTPRTNFPGTQEEHDSYHMKRAQEYEKAAKLLSNMCTPVEITKIGAIPYQVCPLCDGNGQTIANNFTSSVYQTCKVCSGTKIIPMGISI